MHAKAVYTKCVLQEHYVNKFSDDAMEYNIVE